MILREFFMRRYDGVDLYRTYSDEDYYIERDGELYEEAIDPDGMDRVYTETDIKIPSEENDEEESNEEIIEEI